MTRGSPGVSRKDRKYSQKLCVRCDEEFSPRGTKSKHCSIWCSFMSKVQIGDECWEWDGAHSTGGYAQIYDGERVIYAHRWAFINLGRGTLPEGQQIDHLCRNRGCVNPKHLEPVTNRENTIRGMKGYHNRTECKHGHDITDPANVYTRPKTGLRSCRECTRINNLAAYYRRKEAKS